MKNSARRVYLKNKTIVIMYMLYFGDMVSITPFLEVLRREAEGSRIVPVSYTHLDVYKRQCSICLDFCIYRTVPDTCTLRRTP